MGKANKVIGVIGAVVTLITGIAAVYNACFKQTRDDPYSPESLAKMSRDELDIKREEVRLNNQLPNWQQLLQLFDKEIRKRDYPNADKEKYIYPKKKDWYLTSDD